MQTLSPYARLAGGRVWPCFLLTPGVPLPPQGASPHTSPWPPLHSQDQHNFPNSSPEGIEGIESRGRRFDFWGLLHSCRIHTPPVLSIWQHPGMSWLPPGVLTSPLPLRFHVEAPTSHHLQDLPLALRSQVRLPGLVPRKEAPIQALHSQILPRCAVPSQAHTYPSLSATQ